MLSWLCIERKLLQQLVHEFFAESELSGMMRRGRSQLEDETPQMARLLCMIRQHSEGRFSVMRGGRCYRLYCVRARAEK